MNKKSYRILIAIIIIVQAAIALSGCSIFPTEEEPDVPALKTPKPIEYSFYQVKKGTLTSSTAGIGTVNSIYYTAQSFPVNGSRFKALYVELGQYVKEGDLLMELDNSDLEIDYLQAELAYERQKMVFEDQQAQYNNGSISDTAYRVAELELENARKQYESIKAAYEGTKLYAKVSGKVVYINSAYTAATEAKEIVAGETMIAIDPENPDYIYLEFDKSGTVTENAPQQFRIGAKLTLTLLDNAGKPVVGVDQFQGTVVSIDSLGASADTSNKYYCKMENPPAEVVVGSSVRYDYTEYSIEDCLIIPTSALYEFNGNQFVYMLDSDTNLRVQVPVQIGYRTSSQAQVLDGLKAGDVIIDK